MRSITRVLLFVAIVGSFCLGWLAHTQPDVVAAQGRNPIMMTRIYTGPDGLSHAEEIEMKLNRDDQGDRRGVQPQSAGQHQRVAYWAEAPVCDHA